jgi:hypothetical protein
MITTEQPESAKTTQKRAAGSDLQSEKIIDFFTARRALLKETEAEDRLLGLEETVRLAAEQRRRYIRLPDPVADCGRAEFFALPARPFAVSPVRRLALSQLCRCCRGLLARELS